MATSVKTKFAGFLRGLFGRAESGPSARATNSPAPAPQPAATSFSNRTSPAPAPRPATRPATAPAPAKAGFATPAPAPGAVGEIELPLATVIAALPMDLRAKLSSAAPANATICLQAEMVISQLAFGAVRIFFGDLRRLAPGTFVNSGGELDGKLISLPLQEILPRLNPALLSRRVGRKIEVAEDIVGPFAERGRGFTFTTQPLKGPTVPVAVSNPAPAPAPAAIVPPIAVRPPSSPAVSAPPPRSITPAAPLNGGPANPPGLLPISPLSPRSVTPAPSAGLSLNGNGHGLNGHGTNGHANGHSHAEPRPGSANGHEAPAPMRLAPTPAAPAAPEATIWVALKDLWDAWPEPLKEEIALSPLAQARVALEAPLILPGLKRGRIVIPWKQLRLLAAPGSAPSSNDKLELELPLKVIAPLFVAAQKAPARNHGRAAVSAEIPDLFFGFPQPAPAAPEASPTKSLPTAQPVAAPAPVAPLVPPLPRMAEQKSTDTNYFTAADQAGPAAIQEVLPRPNGGAQTDFLNRAAHPKDIVARAAALPGVAGSLVAMQDGLRVASMVPTELNGDTLAAFLPQIFERVNQTTRELRMGALNNVNFTVGNIPWKIFRVNAVYFAAFGCAGEQLPSAQLAQLAAELDRKKA